MNRNQWGETDEEQTMRQNRQMARDNNPWENPLPSTQHALKEGAKNRCFEHRAPEIDVPEMWKKVRDVLVNALQITHSHAWNHQYSPNMRKAYARAAAFHWVTLRIGQSQDCHQTIAIATWAAEEAAKPFPHNVGRP